MAQKLGHFPVRRIVEDAPQVVLGRGLTPPRHVADAREREEAAAEVEQSFQGVMGMIMGPWE